MSGADNNEHRYGRTKVCPNCSETIIVVRHPEDGTKPARELKTADIRLMAIHRVDAGELVEAATGAHEFGYYASKLICKRRSVVDQEEGMPWA